MASLQAGESGPGPPGAATASSPFVIATSAAMGSAAMAIAPECRRIAPFHHAGVSSKSHVKRASGPAKAIWTT